MGWRPLTGVRCRAGLLALAAILSLASSAHADITYIYDALGRLRGVVDPASDTAIYSYDAVGCDDGRRRADRESLPVHRARERRHRPLLLPGAVLQSHVSALCQRRSEVLGDLPGSQVRSCDPAR